MKREIILGCITILQINSINYAADTAPKRTREITIALPSAQILGERLKGMGLHSFIEKTKIDRELGGKKVTPLDVAIATTNAFNKCFVLERDQSVEIEMLKKMDSDILKSILQDSPKAIEELESLGVIKKPKVQIRSSL